jgi:hypothetical protein
LAAPENREARQTRTNSTGQVESHVSRAGLVQVDAFTRRDAPARRHLRNDTLEGQSRPESEETIYGTGRDPGRQMTSGARRCVLYGIQRHACRGDRKKQNQWCLKVHGGYCPQLALHASDKTASPISFVNRTAPTAM